MLCDQSLQTQHTDVEVFILDLLISRFFLTAWLSRPQQRGASMQTATSSQENYDSLPFAFGRIKVSFLPIEVSSSFILHLSRLQESPASSPGMRRKYTLPKAICPTAL